MSTVSDGAAPDSDLRELALRTEPRGSWSWLSWTCFWLLCFAALTLLVHTRALGNVDQSILMVVAANRQVEASGVMNWIFRLGFAQVDAVVAVIWAGALLARRISLSVGATKLPLVLAPLLLFAVIAIQAGFRLVVDQPAPGSAYALHRQFAAQPVADVLDRTDAAARQGFLQATSPLAPPAVTPQNAVERGSYPSGHSSRLLFLAGLVVSLQLSAIRTSRMRRGGWSRAVRTGVAASAVALVGLVSYSAMYFGYHWPSDILGGFLLALAVLPLAIRAAQHPHLC